MQAAPRASMLVCFSSKWWTDERQYLQKCLSKRASYTWKMAAQTCPNPSTMRHYLLLNQIHRSGLARVTTLSSYIPPLNLSKYADWAYS